MSKATSFAAALNIAVDQQLEDIRKFLIENIGENKERPFTVCVDMFSYHTIKVFVDTTNRDPTMQYKLEFVDDDDESHCYIHILPKTAAAASK